MATGPSRWDRTTANPAVTGWLRSGWWEPGSAPTGWSEPTGPYPWVILIWDCGDAWYHQLRTRLPAIGLNGANSVWFWVTPHWDATLWSRHIVSLPSNFQVFALFNLANSPEIPKIRTPLGSDLQNCVEPLRGIVDLSHTLSTLTTSVILPFRRLQSHTIFRIMDALRALGVDQIYPQGISPHIVAEGFWGAGTNPSRLDQLRQCCPNGRVPSY